MRFSYSLLSLPEMPQNKGVWITKGLLYYIKINFASGSNFLSSESGCISMVHVIYSMPRN